MTTQPIPYTTVAADLAAFAQRYGAMTDRGALIVRPRIAVPTAESRAVTQRIEVCRG